MGLLTFAGRIVLVVVNIVFILVALTLIVAGFVIRLAHEWLKPMVKDVLAKLESTVQDVYGDASYNTDNFEFGSLVSTLCYIMIVAGVVLLAVAFLGCCGACCSLTTLCLVYAIILIAVLLVQVGLVVLVFGKPVVIKDQIKSSLKGSMSGYDGIKGTTVSAMGWNWMQQQYSCCGADTYQDFDDENSQYKKDTSSNDNSAIGGTTGDVGVPVACCKTLPTSDAERTTCAGTGGAVPTDATKSNMNNGCVEAVWDIVVDGNSLYFWIPIGFCFVVQIVLIIFAILVYKNRGITGGLI